MINTGSNTLLPNVKVLGISSLRFLLQHLIVKVPTVSHITKMHNVVMLQGRKPPKMLSHHNTLQFYIWLL